jgi:predicted transposase/invertase (TIGR01784 family)
LGNLSVSWSAPFRYPCLRLRLQPQHPFQHFSAPLRAQGYREKKGENFYYRFIGEIHLYLKDYQPSHNWQAVVIFTEKRFDPGIPRHYAEYENNPRLQRIYLNKLPPEVGDRSLGLGMLQLLGTSQKQAPAKGRALIDRTQQELTDVTIQRNFVELVETIFVYKFPQLNSREIGQMLGLAELKQTRVYQEAQEEKRDEMLEKMVPKLIRRGLTVEEIADDLELPIETIQRFLPQA